jgi:hypothetical protein
MDNRENERKLFVFGTWWHPRHWGQAFSPCGPNRGKRDLLEERVLWRVVITWPFHKSASGCYVMEKTDAKFFRNLEIWESAVNVWWFLGNGASRVECYRRGKHACFGEMMILAKLPEVFSPSDIMQEVWTVVEEITMWWLMWCELRAGCNVYQGCGILEGRNRCIFEKWPIKSQCDLWSFHKNIHHFSPDERCQKELFHTQSLLRYWVGDDVFGSALRHIGSVMPESHTRYRAYRHSLLHLIFVSWLLICIQLNYEHPMPTTQLIIQGNEEV